MGGNTGLGRAEPGIEALVATSEERNAGELFLEGEVVDDEAVELEAPGRGVVRLCSYVVRGGDVPQWNWLRVG